MEKAKHSVAFEAEVEEGGRVHFSRAIGGALQLRQGAKVTVHIVGGVLSRELAARNVTDEEIERIGTVQFEDREHVVKFLRSEGALAGSRGFRKRAKGIKR